MLALKGEDSVVLTNNKHLDRSGPVIRFQIQITNPLAIIQFPNQC